MFSRRRTPFCPPDVLRPLTRPLAALRRSSIYPYIALGFAVLMLAGVSSASAASRAATSAQGFSVSQSISDGQTLSGQVAWTVTASTTVRKVEFFIDGSYKWTENLTPYVFNGDGNTLDTTSLSNGSHTFSVQVYGNDGTTVTAAVTATVSNGSAPAPSPSATPTPTPTTPTTTTSSETTTSQAGLSVSQSISDGQTLSGRVSWTVTANLGIRKVDFFIDGVYKWTENYAPYVFNGDGNTLDTTSLSNGSHSFAVKVYGTDGSSVTATANATVSNGTSSPASSGTTTVSSGATTTTTTPTTTTGSTAPTSSVAGFSVTQSIANGQTLSGQVSWTALPNMSVGDITFSIDGIHEWTEYYAPYVFNGDGSKLDTTTLSDGSHTFTVTAYRKDGTATSVVTATVDNGSGASPLVASAESKILPVQPLNLPAAGHIWGGNSDQAYRVADVVITNLANDASQGTAVAEARVTNPHLIALLAPAFDPQHAFQFTYGHGLEGWSGADDTLAPNPQGQIRSWSNSDWGCTQADGITGFNLAQSSTANFIKDADFYSWKLTDAAALGFNGIWSDNLVPGNLIHAGWFYGSSCPLSESAWDSGFKTIADGLRSLTGGALVGGNTSFRATDPSVRASTDVSMYEQLNITVNQGPSAFASILSQVQAWQATTNGSGNPKILVVMDQVPQTATQRLRLGLALTTILGGAYIPYQTHSDLYFPSEMYRNGQRGYLGQPAGAAVQVGSSAWTRPFQHGSVYANMGDAAVVIDGVTVPAHDGVLRYTG